MQDSIYFEGRYADNTKCYIFYEEAMKSHLIETKIIGKLTEVPKEVLKRGIGKRTLRQRN